MPPSRRRPVPTPPAGGRPKVAGLAKRPAAPTDPATEASTPDQPGTHGPSVSGDDTKHPRVPKEAAVDGGAGEEGQVTAVVEAEVAEPESVTEVAEATGVTEDEAPAKQLSWALPVGLLVVAVLLGGLGVFFQTRDEAAVDLALVDANATSEVNGQVREGVEKAFSYNFADVESTEKAANELLTGKAKCQYNAVFGPVKTLAPEQKLVVTVKVVASAVSSLKDDHANVLVFVDQVTTRTTDNQTGGGTAMLRASAQKADGRWKIDNLEMFGQTPEQAEQMKQCQ